MAGSGTPRPRGPQPTPPSRSRKPPLVMHISRRDQQEESPADLQAPVEADAPAMATAPVSPPDASPAARVDPDSDGLEGLTMADLLGPDGPAAAAGRRRSSPAGPRTVDEFDFDEAAFLAALDENEPVGTTGEVVTGTVINQDGDGVYVDIGGKAPAFMPKKECGLGVMTDLRSRFPQGLPVEVLVTREQNADGMVTVSCRALALRQSWEKVRRLAEAGAVVQVKVNGFNRGGITCDLEGLRGFVPRSQLLRGEQHESLVGETLGVTFLEVNPETRKLVLSEKKASSAARFSELEVGQLVEGHVASVKPYGFFIDLGGVSGLLHQSCVTGGHLRHLRDAFSQGDPVRALITELDPGRGRIALNTALLEGQPGELLTDRDRVMAEAEDRAKRAQSILRQQEQEAG
ncbi:S1 RNA-binding domain-containing protein [Synechococcus sp. RSCCF101]|uniref:S1 RNA-binding domain-containing protein n=1 Tax=Synechococcus sp. RSCCF101 TaxID=2511069 RepID=UPI001247F9CE|nr:S1 RNA-binding domain-containing protein [Synechococcus sp. RSCCF101]QEY31362.1 S1 RNA-binding domain-containing protein [Synechococcus sp. RSCCF101]